LENPAPHSASSSFRGFALRALAGFEAYRYVVLRVPGMWWMVPFFYTPVLSRLLGHPIYNWIAQNRARLSARSGENPGNLDSVARA